MPVGDNAKSVGRLRARRTRQRGAFAALWLAGGALLAAPQTLPQADAKLTNPAEIHRRFTNGLVHVIVTLAPPVQPGATDLRSPAARAQVQSQVRAAQQAVLNTLPARDVAVRRRFDNIAGFSALVTTNGLRALQAHPAVQAIEPVVELEPHLAQGIPLIGGLTYRPLYYGQGVAIAICDTGIDYTHPRLGGGGFPNAKVIGGYDFGDDDPDPMPNAQAHGTACAGIAAGDLGTVGDYIGGVAPGAKLYALKITAGTGGSATTADMVAAWDWCVTHRDDDPNNPLLVISTSFGGGRYFSPCDSASPSMTAAANNAVAAGITVLASSGNDGYCDSLSWPSCISSVISVGAVYDAAFGNFLPCISGDSCAPKNSGGCSTGWYAIDTTAPDKVTSYANVASFLTLFAPANQCYTLDIVGSSGYSGDDYFSGFGGTSAACPYAAGAVAALQSAAKALRGNFLSPDLVKSLLIEHGDNVTDTKVAITKPRVNLERAIQALDTNVVAWFVAVPTNGPVPLTVAFTNQSLNATDFLWSFGDGQTATNVHPVHTYTNAGVYSVELRAVGAAGTNTMTRTNYVVVTNVPPTILTQPQDQLVPLGGTAGFSVAVTGTPPVSFQWRFNGADVPGATDSAFVRSNAQLADIGAYSVVVSNIAGSVTSAAANLMVVVMPGVISVTGVPYTQNFDTMGPSGTTTPFGWYVGTGTGAISGTNVTVSNGSSSTRANYNFGTTGDGDRALGSIAGNNTQRNTEARFVNVSGSFLSALTISYTGEQWRRGGANSVNNQLVLQFSTDGSTFTPLGAAFNFNTPVDTGGAAALDGNALANRVTGIGGIFSPPNFITNGQVFYLRWADPDDPGTDHGIALDDLTITFTLTNPPPIITAQPQSQTVIVGSNVTFSVGAIGLPPLTYQWQFNAAALPAATNSTLTLTNVQFSQAGDYTVVVSNNAGSVTSAVATLTVILPPPAPIADFAAEPTNGLAPLTVAFTNLSLNASDFVWDFGDGNSSTNAHPTNVYSNAGSFTVTLTAIGPGGSNVLTRPDYIVVTNPPPPPPAPIADFAAEPTNGLAPLTVAFTNLSLNASDFLWDFGDGNSSSNTHPTNVYSNAGSFTVTLTAIGPGGSNLLTRTNYIVVLNPPLLSVSPETLNFGNVLTGRVAQASFVVSNAGGAALTGTAALEPGPSWIGLLDAESNLVTALGFTVDGLGVTNLIVRFVPETVGGFTNAVVFTSNGGDLTNHVVGVGVGAPVILWVTNAGAEIVFAFETAAGLNYEVQAADSLETPVWQPLMVLPGDGNVQFVTNTVVAPGQRFYRLRVE